MVRTNTLKELRKSRRDARRNGGKQNTKKTDITHTQVTETIKYDLWVSQKQLEAQRLGYETKIKTLEDKIRELLSDDTLPDVLTGLSDKDIEHLRTLIHTLVFYANPDIWKIQTELNTFIKRHNSNTAALAIRNVLFGLSNDVRNQITDHIVKNGGAVAAKTLINIVGGK
jgi:hypothetical protein